MIPMSRARGESLADKSEFSNCVQAEDGMSDSLYSVGGGGVGALWSSLDPRLGL